MGIGTQWRDTTSNFPENGTIGYNLVHANRYYLGGSDGIKGTASQNTIFEYNVVYNNVTKAEESFKELASEKIKSQLKRMVSEKWPIGENPVKDQIETPNGEALNSTNVEKFVKENLKDKLKVQPTSVPDKDSKPQQMVSAKIKMVPEHLKIRAGKYKPLVDKYCTKRNLDKSVVYGLIHTESYFNPMARSHIPAFGLMQIVPTSGGRDAYKYVYKKDKKPSAEFLYDHENNTA